MSLSRKDCVSEMAFLCEDCGVEIDPDFTVAHPNLCCVCDMIREVE